jgi:hypothetical protein
MYLERKSRFFALELLQVCEASRVPTCRKEGIIEHKYTERVTLATIIEQLKTTRKMQSSADLSAMTFMKDTVGSVGHEEAPQETKRHTSSPLHFLPAKPEKTKLFHFHWRFAVGSKPDLFFISLMWYEESEIIISCIKPVSMSTRNMMFGYMRSIKVKDTLLCGMICEVQCMQITEVC